MKLFHPVILACHVYCVSPVASTHDERSRNGLDPVKMAKFGLIVEKKSYHCFNWIAILYGFTFM